MNYLGGLGVGAVSASRSGALAATGIPFILHWTMLGVVLIIAGGIVMIAARLAPRFALDPIQDESGKYRLRFTRNGRPRADRKR